MVTACGALIPNRHPFLPNLRPIVWLTTMERADAEALGLTSSDLVRCDRTEHRFRVTDTSSCFPWRAAVDNAPAWAIDPAVIDMLERGRRSDTWWISALPVPVARA